MSPKKERFTDVVQMTREVAGEGGLADELAKRLEQRQIVKHLFALRSVKGVSQKDIAERLGCTQSKVSKLESGTDADLKLEELAAYADALGCDVHILLAPTTRTPVTAVLLL